MTEMPASYDGLLVEWSDIEDSARELFDVWVTGTEREWSEKAWGMLVQRGLTRYSDAIEQTGVLIRLLTLAMLYREWCWLAREESCHEGVMREMAEYAGINPFRVAQVMGMDFEARDYDSDEDDLLEMALVELCRRERPAICQALVDGFGGAIPLHNALAATTRGNDPEDDEGDSTEDFASGQALSWIMQGMPVL